MTNGEGWKTDEDGRKYRLFGSSKEYAPEYVFSSGYYEKEHETPKAPQTQETLYTGKQCPVKKGTHRECVKDCPLYGVTACIMTAPVEVPEKDTKGGYCPIRGRNCGEECALYIKGCGLRKIARELMATKNGKEGS